MAAPGLSRVRLSMKIEGEKMTVYEREIEKIAKSNLPWEDLEGKTVFISGATGMIGKCLDVKKYDIGTKDTDCSIEQKQRTGKRAFFCLSGKTGIFV